MNRGDNCEGGFGVFRNIFPNKNGMLRTRLFFSRLPLKEFKFFIFEVFYFYFFNLRLQLKSGFFFFLSKKIKSGTKGSNGTGQHINHTAL